MKTDLNKFSLSSIQRVQVFCSWCQILLHECICVWEKEANIVRNGRYVCICKGETLIKTSVKNKTKKGERKSNMLPAAISSSKQKNILQKTINNALAKLCSHFYNRYIVCLPLNQFKCIMCMWSLQKHGIIWCRSSIERSMDLVHLIQKYYQDMII